MCVGRGSILAQPFRTSDLLRSKIADKIGLQAPRDFAAEWVNGKAASNNNYKRERAPVVSDGSPYAGLVVRSKGS